MERHRAARIKHGTHICLEISEVRKGLWAFLCSLCFSDADWLVGKLRSRGSDECVSVYYKRDKNLFVKHSDTVVLSCNYLQLTDMHQSYFDA